MLTFEVKDMTCGHCVNTITKAVEAADPGARVQIDLAARLVQIQPVSSDRARLAQVISEAGYTATDAVPVAGSAPEVKRSGCCCA
jgi:copper chaperone